MKNLLPLRWASILLLTIGVGFGAANAQPLASAATYHYSQDEQWQPLQTVLQSVQENYEVYLNYKTSLVQGKEVNIKTIKIGKNRVEEVLQKVLVPHELSFEKLKDNYYVIFQQSQLPSLTPLDLGTQPTEEKERPGNLLSGLESRWSPQPQITLEQTVRGTVTDLETDEPLPGVNVLAKSTTTGTVTDVDGNYRLTVGDDVTTLVFSSVGYLSEEVGINGRNIVNLSLSPDIQALEEVVVVGYGAVKKSDLTGSVSSVKAEELTAYPAIGAVQALQGRAAGVQITANNGEPGADFKVRVRGGTSINASSDPIYVVDGFVGAALPPPEDIESIEVLKDASATAIYGSRGANGVIMVTTKRGSKGQAKIDFNASYSLQNEINRLDLLNKEQFTEYIQDTNPDFTPLDGNTDWQDEIFQTGNIQNYQLGISGGADNLSYYLSGTYFDQEGIIINSGFRRYSITSNIEIQAAEKFKVGLNLFAQRSQQNGARTQEGSGGANNSGVVAAAFKFGPDQPIRDANGNYTLARLSDAHDNAVAVATEYIDENVTDRFQGNLFAEYQIFDNLSFRTTLGVSSNNGRTGQYTPTALQGGAGVGGDGRVNGSKNSLLLNENYLTYSKEFGIHNLTVMGGYSYQVSREEDWGGRSQSFPTDAGLYWNLGAGSVFQRPGSEFSEWELASWYGRVNYSLNDKYLITLNARYDGSSVFSEGNKWAFFPSGAFAWNMGDEGFMQNIEPISFWKWRVSYGVTGNRAINPYQTLAALRAIDVLAIENGTPVNAITIDNVANENLSWESTTQLDIGVDIGLFNDRINLNMDYYRMVTDDLLFRVPLPEYSGFGSQLKNIGKVENRGFELTLNSRNISGEFIWDMGFNVSANRNQILELPDGNEILYRSGPGHMVGLGDTQILREGEPVGVFYGWIYDGVYQEGDDFIEGGGFEQEAGGERFRDIDSRDENGELTGVPDGQLNNDDRTVIGDPNPDFIWGFNNDFRWKGFDLNVFFQASQGNEIFNYTLMELDLMAGRNNATTAALDRWTPTNTNTDIPKASGGRARRASTRWIQDGSFIRLKNLALGYNIPQVVLDRLNIRKLRVYVSAQNLLTFTDYEGYDPEVNYRSGGGGPNSDRDSNRNLGLDYASYPNAKSYTFGINLGF
ncbi:MAG: TonB-dependent receptor [Bacteroidota bacterium]